MALCLLNLYTKVYWTSQTLKSFKCTVHIFLGSLYITILTYTNYFYLGSPVMPLAINIHERKFKSSHSMFWARVLCDIPALAKYRLISVKGIVDRISSCSPWNLSENDVEDIVVLLAWKVFSSNNFIAMFMHWKFVNYFCWEIPWMKIIFWIKQSFQGYRCESDIPLDISEIRSTIPLNWKNKTVSSSYNKLAEYIHI